MKRSLLGSPAARSPHDPCTRHPRSLVAVVAFGAALSFACQVPPRSAVDTEQRIAAAAGLPGPIALRFVGPDGGPLDETESEPTDASGALTFAVAVRRAVTTDPELQAALARVKGAVAAADQARLLPNPVLGITLRGGSGRPEVEASFVAEFVAALQRPARASAADQRLRASAAEAVVTALDIIASVSERYIAAQTSTVLLPLLEERLRLVQRLVATASARLDAGEGTRADRVTLDAERVELEVTIERARMDARTNRLRLARAIGVPSAAADWTLDAWSPPDAALHDESVWVQAALAARPELHEISWRLAALGDDARLLSHALYDSAGAGVDAQWNDGLALGPTLSVPLPLLDDGSARADALAAETLTARHELTLARRRVVEEVRTAYEALSAGTANLKRVHGELMPLHRQRRELAEDAYRAGVIDVTPLLLAEQHLRVAETQAIEWEAQAALALVRLQRAVGGPGVAASPSRSAVFPAGPPREFARADSSSNPSTDER